MSSLILDGEIRFFPFSRQADGDEVVIGRAETGVFLALPAEAMEVVDLLGEGSTAEEAANRYAARHGERPDVAGLVDFLAAKGFVVPPGSSAEAPDRLAAGADSSIRYHFANFPQRLAQRLFGRAALAAYAGVIALALLAVVLEPSLVPHRQALFFERHVTAMVLLVMAAGLLTTFFHEMAHLVAARARGVLCRLGIGNRLWILVAETDMTGVWALPRRQRYLPILAGPLLDGVSAACLVLVAFAHLRGWIGIPPTAFKLVQALILIYWLRILWQCFFFVRTDFYYVYTMALGCKNLMQDTQDFLRNGLARLTGRRPTVDQRHLPAREMRAIRVYSLFWLAGRGIAFFTLVYLTIPLSWSYLVQIAATLTARRGDLYDLVDSCLITAIQLGFASTGLWLWIRSLRQARRLKNELAE